MHLRIAPAPDGKTRPRGEHLRGARQAWFARATCTAAMALVGCVGELPPGAAAPDFGIDFADRPDVAENPTDGARPNDASTRDGDLDFGPATDADPTAPDLGDALVPPDAQTLDFNPIPDQRPTDEGVLDLVGVPDTYLLSGACPLSVGAENGLLANDGLPAGTSVEAEVHEFTAAGATLVRLDADGGFEVEPGGVDDIRFTYRLVVDGVRSAPITVDLRQPENAIIVNTASDDENLTGGLCSLRSAIRAANEDDDVQGCRGGRGADTIVFAAPDYTITLNGGPHGSDPFPDFNVTESAVAILGCGANSTAIDANFLGRHFDVAVGASLELRGLTLRNGEQIRSPGGALRVLGSVELANVIIETSNYTAPNGGVGSAQPNGANAGGGGGGGGAAGIAGAVYVGNGARLTAYGTRDTCAFLNNFAQGGNGGGSTGASGAAQGNGGNGGGSGGGSGGVPGPNPTGAEGRPGGGGGGGAGVNTATGNGLGGRGGFGGGGGGTGARLMAPEAGSGLVDGGFGGGAGGARACFRSGPGGGGAAFGGAIYNDNGIVEINGCRFAGNQARGGAGGPPIVCADLNVVPLHASPGRGLGASIFTRGVNARTTTIDVVNGDGGEPIVLCRDLAGCTD